MKDEVHTEWTHGRLNLIFPFFCVGLECRRKVVRRATTSEDTSSRYPAEDRDGVTIVEEVPIETNTYTENFPSEVPKEESPMDVQEQSFDLLEKINLKVCVRYHI